MTSLFPSLGLSIFAPPLSGSLSSASDRIELPRSATTQLQTHSNALEEALDFEVHVDLTRLKELACLGVPSRLRPKAYPLLLGVAPVDKTAEMTSARVQHEVLISMVGPEATRGRRLRRFLAGPFAKRLPPVLKANLVALGNLPQSIPSAPAAAPSAAVVVSAFLAPLPVERRQQLTLEAVLAITIPEMNPATCYARGLPMHLPMMELAAAAAHPKTSDYDGCRLCPSVPPDGRHFATHFTFAPLTWILYAALLMGQVTESAVDAFYGVQTITAILMSPSGCWTSSGLRDQYSLFTMVLHFCCEEVYNHFHTLGINNLRWAPQLLSSLFLDRMPTPELLLLWDNYVALNDFTLHPYVCIAIVDHWTERLLESDADEVIAIFNGPWDATTLPPVATLLRAAAKLREEVRDRKLV